MIITDNHFIYCATNELGTFSKWASSIEEFKESEGYTKFLRNSLLRGLTHINISLSKNIEVIILGPIAQQTD